MLYGYTLWGLFFVFILCFLWQFFFLRFFDRDVKLSTGVKVSKALKA